MEADRAKLTSLAGRRVGNYRLERLLGSGRMGVVYLARDEALLRPTALKILSWAFDTIHGQDPLRWFLEEARAIARVAHPGVVQIYSVAAHGRYHYIVMEYVDGVSGEQLLKQRGHLEPVHATRLLVQAAAALHAAHMANVIHRDVKPANLLMTNDGNTVKLGDFGMALGPEAAGAQDGSLRVGTPYFTAPELWMGGRATPACDIYSLGATYFQLLTGHHPFEAKAMEDLQRMHLEHPVPDPREHDPSIPEACARIVQRCLVKSPTGRFSSAEELAWTARHWLGHDGVPVKAKARPPLHPIESTLDLSSTRAMEPQPWLDKLDFAVVPFGHADPRRCPYGGPPFDAVRSKLVRALEGRARIVLLTGEPSTGRTTVCKSLAVELTGKHLVFYVRARRSSSSLLERVVKAVIGDRAPFENRAACIDALLGALAEGQQNWPGAPVIILDDLPAAPTDRELEDLSVLARASRNERTFSLLLVGSVGSYIPLPELVGPDADLVDVSLPAMSDLELLEYARAWLRSIRSESSPNVLITPDAAFLVGQLTDGSLQEANHLLRNALLVALQRKERVLGSWHVWAVHQHADQLADDGQDGAFARQLVRPEAWPTEDVLELLNRRRARAGLPRLVHSAERPDPRDQR
ncbi:MAG: serine/threonine-protein kinase [Myxococcales bacterium]|nr:serine/threonine-protein kinase [Myxococcales bacterium]